MGKWFVAVKKNAKNMFALFASYIYNNPLAELKS